MATVQESWNRAVFPVSYNGRGIIIPLDEHEIQFSLGSFDGVFAHALVARYGERIDNAPDVRVEATDDPRVRRVTAQLPAALSRQEWIDAAEDALRVSRLVSDHRLWVFQNA